MSTLGRGGVVAWAILTGACASQQQSGSDVGLVPIRNGQTELLDAARGRQPITDADVHFMSGMIAHHAQAVQMAKLVPTHCECAALKRFAERIVNAQADEIVVMQDWLREHGKPVPNATDTKMHMSHGGTTHDMLMPGMLTDEEMAALGRARGVDFERLFLVGMIKHHEGALTMIEEVLAAPGAVQDDVVFKFTNDIFADQTTEIAVMNDMLARLPAR